MFYPTRRVVFFGQATIPTRIEISTRNQVFSRRVAFFTFRRLRRANFLGQLMFCWICCWFTVFARLLMISLILQDFLGFSLFPWIFHDFLDILWIFEISGDFQGFSNISMNFQDFVDFYAFSWMFKIFLVFLAFPCFC